MKKIILLLIIAAPSLSFAQPDFQKFDTWEEAAFHYIDHHETYNSGLRMREPYKMLTHDDHLYRELERNVEIVHNAFIELYGNAIQKETPHVLILDSSLDSALVPKPNENNKAPYKIVFHKKLLENSREAVMGVAAHELAHLHLQWKEKGVRFPKKKNTLKGISKQLFLVIQ